MNTLLVALVAVAGIAATYFAPVHARRSGGRRAHERELRAAARLVGHDLNLIAVQLNVLVDQGRAGADDVARLPLAAWGESKHALAASLTWDDWQLLANVFGRAESLRSLLNGRATLDAKTRELLADTARKAQSARDLLAPLAS